MEAEIKEFLSKVPAVTFGFWVIKIFATTLGETGGNAVSRTLGLGYFIGTLIFLVPLLLIVAAQIRAKGFRPFLYWGTIALTTLIGTTLADFFTRSIGIGYAGGSLVLFAFVLITLGLWYWFLGSIDIKTVVEPKAELFYWSTILFSQTLGTALGDWLADGALGYNGSALLIAGVLGGLALFYYFTKVSHVLLFWAAFILTRPLGATLANSLDKPIEQGGLDINDITITIVLAVMMLFLLVIIPQRSGDH
jgi:uncharacterized membrane-anchored protein